MARSDAGMSPSTKLVLAILGTGGVLGIVCCGVLAWWGSRLWQDFKQTFKESIAEELDELYVDDPAQIAELTARIVDIRVPPRYAPFFGTDHTFSNVMRRQVMYVSDDQVGGLVIREMLTDDVISRDEVARILSGELSEDGWVYESEPESTSQRTFTINGEECVFEFRAGKDSDSGNEMRQAAGVVPSGSGLAYLVVYDTAANWDEAAIVAMIESIRIGRPDAAAGSAPAVSSPATAVPMEVPPVTPPESPAETPAESTRETSGTAEGAPATPQ